MGAWSDPTRATVCPVLFGGFSGMEGARSNPNHVVVCPRWRETVMCLMGGTARVLHLKRMHLVLFGDGGPPESIYFILSLKKREERHR